jgi:hypothetical protein
LSHTSIFLDLILKQRTLIQHKEIDGGREGRRGDKVDKIVKRGRREGGRDRDRKTEGNNFK